MARSQENPSHNPNEVPKERAIVRWEKPMDEEVQETMDNAADMFDADLDYFENYEDSRSYSRNEYVQQIPPIPDLKVPTKPLPTYEQMFAEELKRQAENEVEAFANGIKDGIKMMKNTAEKGVKDVVAAAKVAERLIGYMKLSAKDILTLAMLAGATGVVAGDATEYAKQKNPAAEMSIEKTVDTLLNADPNDAAEFADKKLEEHTRQTVRIVLETIDLAKQVNAHLQQIISEEQAKHAATKGSSHAEATFSELPTKKKK